LATRKDFPFIPFGRTRLVLSVLVEEKDNLLITIYHGKMYASLNFSLENADCKILSETDVPEAKVDRALALLEPKETGPIFVGRELELIQSFQDSYNKQPAP
jgi:hypothetical protein